MMNLEQYEHTYKPYGQCPVCKDNCQPDYIGGDRSLEYAVCCNCKIWWYVYPDDKRYGVHGDIFRISDIESWEDEIVPPVECKDNE